MARCFIALLALCLVQGSVAQTLTVNADEKCNGVSPALDHQCSKFKKEAPCSKQVGCQWGTLSTSQCFAKDGDPSLDAMCKKMNQTKCDVQVACTWRSQSDAHSVSTQIDTAVKELQAGGAAWSPAPVTMMLGSPSASAKHGHTTCAVAQLEGRLKQWNNKLGLPTSVTDALSVLVAVESTEYKEYHASISNSVGSVQLVAAAGRNWGGVVTLAFVSAEASVSYTTYRLQPLYCQDTHQFLGGLCHIWYCGGSAAYPQCGQTTTFNTNFACATTGPNNALCSKIPDNTGRALQGDELSAIASSLQQTAFQTLQNEGDKLKRELFHHPISDAEAVAEAVTNAPTQAVVV